MGHSTLRVASRFCAGVFAFLPALAQAQETTPAEPDSLPGASRSVGLSLSPEAPPTPPAPGGRAPSFAAPADPDAWTFRIGGRISGYAQVGIGRRPEGDTNGDLRLHTPPVAVGRTPFYTGPSGTLTFQYGSQLIQAFVSLEASLAGKQWNGYHTSEFGPRIKTAYVVVNPAPIGSLRLKFQVGAFPANYGAPGPWGWGMFGPVLAIHGYGGTAAANYELTPRAGLSLEYGITGVPEVDEATARGTFTDWPEAGLSTIVHHAHAGLSFDNQYYAKLHLARATGRNFRKFLDDAGRDGHMDVAALELKWMADPYGQLGITPVYWNFDHALAVHDGIWWAMDWTAGGREMTNKFLGPLSDGTGQIVAASAQYDFSVKRMLLYPQPFDGNGPDLRVALAAMPFWTVSSEDPNFDGTSGYVFGASLQHVLLPWLSTTYHVFGESRNATTVDVEANVHKGTWSAFSGTVGVMLHSSWQSQDRIVLAYSHHFYSSFADSNPTWPLDRELFTVGGSVAF